MPQTTLVIISSPTRAGSDHITGMLESEAGIEIRVEPQDGTVEAIEVPPGRPCILILDLGPNWEHTLQSLNHKLGGRNIPVVVMAMDSNPDIMRAAMRAGARDFNVHPVDRNELLADVRRFAAEAVENLASSEVRSNSQGTLTAVINSKGGSGASFLACSLAHILQTHREANTALIDMDMQFGALPLALDLKTRDTLFDALGSADQLDRIALQGYMTKHESGLSVLGAMSPELPMPWQVSMEDVAKLLNVARNTFAQVVVDLPRSVDPLTSTVLESADHIMLVMQQSFAHLRDTVRMNGILNRHLGIPVDRIHLVVNRYNDKNPVTLDDIRDALKPHALTTLPNDFYNVSESLNLGIPLYKRARNAALTKAICELSGGINNIDLDGDEQRAATGLRGRFSNVFGRS